MASIDPLRPARSRALIGLGIVLGLGLAPALAQQCPAGQLFVQEMAGFGEIGPGGASAARDRAIRDAQRLAVEQLGIYIESTTLVVDSAVVDDYILSETTGGSVETFDIVAEGETEGGSYFVTLNACVTEQEVRTGLESIGAIVRQDLGDPKLVVLALDGDSVAVAERVRGELQNHFVNLGFNVRSDEETADMVVRVGAEATAVPRTFGEAEGFTANVTLQFDGILSTGQVVVTWRLSSGSIWRPDVEQATSAALSEVLSPSLAEVTNRIVSALNTTFEVVFDGLPDFSTFLRLESELGGLRGVDDVQQQGFSDGRGTFSGRGSARTEDIASQLEGLILEDLHPNLVLDVLGLSKFRVEFEFVDVE